MKARGGMLRLLAAIVPAAGLMSAAALVLAFAWGLTGCGDPAVAGGATDTETGGAKATGRVLLPGGAPAACAVVELRSQSFLKGPLESDPSTQGTRKVTVDAQGRFRIDSIPPGDWRFEARCGDSLLAVFDAAIPDTAARLEFAAVPLTHPGKVKGRIRYADGALRPSLVRAYGLALSALADSGGGFILAGVPAGSHTLLFSCMLPFQDSAAAPGVRVGSDSTTDIGDVTLGQRAKQGFAIVDGHLRLDGFDPGNPIIYDNDRFDNTADDDFL